jgi:zinc/manganese transport system permease protein
MRHAFLAGTIAAIISGMVGYFVIIRQLSFAAHALGHIGFAGASGALLFGMTPISGQLMLTVLAAFGMGALGERINKSDMVIGVILSFCLGLGTLFLHIYNGYAGQASIILFGNLLGVSTADIQLMLWLMLVCVVALMMISRRLLFSSLEPELALAKGISLTMMSILFLMIVAIAVTLASQVVGVILVFTLVIGPPAIAVQLTHHFWTGMTFSILLSVVIVWASIFISYVTDYPISFLISTMVFFIYILNVTLQHRRR